MIPHLENIARPQKHNIRHTGCLQRKLAFSVLEREEPPPEFPFLKEYARRAGGSSGEQECPPSTEKPPLRKRISVVVLKSASTRHFIEIRSHPSRDFDFAPGPHRGYIRQDEPCLSPLTHSKRRATRPGSSERHQQSHKNKPTE